MFSFLFRECAVCKPYFWGYCCGCHLSHPVPGVKCTEPIFRTSAQIIESCRTRAVYRGRDRIFILCAFFWARGNPKRPNNPKKVSYIIYLNFFPHRFFIPVVKLFVRNAQNSLFSVFCCSLNVSVFFQFFFLVLQLLLCCAALRILLQFILLHLC